MMTIQNEIISVLRLFFYYFIDCPLTCTAAFTCYNDPAILRKKLTPFSIFRDLALRKRDSKKIIVYFYVFFRVYTKIPKLYELVVYSLMEFLGDSVACVSFGTKIQ